MERFFPYQSFNQPDKQNNKELSPYEVFSKETTESQSFRKRFFWLPETDLWCIEDKICPGQNENLWNTTYWSRELILFAECAGAGKNEVIHRLFALVQ